MLSIKFIERIFIPKNYGATGINRSAKCMEIVSKIRWKRSIVRNKVTYKLEKWFCNTDQLMCWLPLSNIRCFKPMKKHMQTHNEKLLLFDRFTYVLCIHNRVSDVFLFNYTVSEVSNQFQRSCLTNMAPSIERDLRIAYWSLDFIVGSTQWDKFCSLNFIDLIRNVQRARERESKKLHFQWKSL